MTIKCGICNEEIPSHSVEKSRGSHYSKHYVNVERILHQDLGMVLEIKATDSLEQKVQELRKNEEPSLVKEMLGKHKINIEKVDSVEKIGNLIGTLESIKRDVDRNRATVISACVGRHSVNIWRSYIHVSDVDICRECQETKLNRKSWSGDSSMIRLKSLNDIVPELKLAQLNKKIWNDIKNETVKIELKRDY